MSARRPSCPFCLEADCLCEDEPAVPVRRLPVPEGLEAAPCRESTEGSTDDSTDLPGGPIRR